MAFFSVQRSSFSVWPILLCALAPALAGCSTPNPENIRLRKLNQDLTAQVAQLTQQKDADARIIAGLMSRSPTIPMLPPDELSKLWVASGITFGQFTGGTDMESGKPYALGLRVYLTPKDALGQSVQVAGSTVIEAFDLSMKNNNQIGRWVWDTSAAKPQWRTFLLENGYEFTCPWQITPKHSDITIRATFTDELTHIPYVAETMVHVELPPPAIPAAAPTTGPSK